MLHRSAFLASLVVSASVAHGAAPTVLSLSEPAADGVVLARQVVPGTATKGLARSRTIYLNRHGIMLSPGPNDSQTQSSTVVSRASQVSAWNPSAADWAATVTCMKGVWDRFDVTVTEVDPGITPHIEAVFGHSPLELDLPSNIGGISPFTNDCSVIESSIVFAFIDNLGKRPRTICEVMSQEIAHSYGLDHELAADDPMSYLPYSGDRQFQDRDVACGESSARPCGVPGATCRASQNSFQLLRARLGAADRDHEAPSVAITEPRGSAAVPAGFSITATASDNIEVKSVAFYLDGELIGTAERAPYQVTTRPDLAQGLHFVYVEGLDGDGNAGTQDLEILVSASADEDGLGCSAGGSPPLVLAGLALVALVRRRRR